MTNPITQQIRDVRHRLAAKFNNDLDQIFADLQRQQSESTREYVDRSKPVESKAEQTNGFSNSN